MRFRPAFVAFGPPTFVADPAMVKSQQLDPLSWSEARQRLRGTLETYLKEERSTPTDRASVTPRTALNTSRSFFTIWIQYDLDVYAGSLLLSIALLVISCISWLDRSGTGSFSAINSQASLSVYTAQLVASVLLLSGALLSLAMLRSHRQLWLYDSENAKRRTIRSFLRKIDRCKNSDNNVQTPPDLDQMNLHGTSLTDSYVSSRRENSSWTTPLFSFLLS